MKAHIEFTRAELAAAYHGAPSHTVGQSGRRTTFHTGAVAVAHFVAERLGVELVIIDPLPPAAGPDCRLPFAAPKGVPEYRPASKAER